MVTDILSEMVRVATTRVDDGLRVFVPGMSRLLSQSSQQICKCIVMKESAAVVLCTTLVTNRCGFLNELHQALYQDGKGAEITQGVIHKIQYVPACLNVVDPVKSSIGLRLPRASQRGWGLCSIYRDNSPIIQPTAVKSLSVPL